jgi:chlorite dismutase
VLAFRNNVLVGVLNQRVLDVGEVHITRTNLGKNRPEKRYLIYLPMNRNYLWKVLHEKNVKVRVFIEIPSEALSKEA